jgi:hypothetical protein
VGRGVSGSGLALLVAGWSAGCQVARTEVVVRVESELAWGEGASLQSVVLTVRRGGAAGPIRSERTTALGRSAGRSALPMHVGVLETSDDRDTPLWLEARGCAGPNGCSADEAAVVQRAVVRFVPESRVLVTLLLASACVGGRCGVEELCVPTTGRCRPAEEATTVVGTGAWPDAGRGVEDRVNVLDARRPDDAGAHAEVLIFDAASAHDAPEEADHAELTDTGTDAEIPEELIFFDVGFPLDAAGSVDREVMVDAQRDASVSNDLLLPDGGVAIDASGDRDDGSLTVDVGLPGEDCGSTPCGQHCSQGFGDCDQDPGNGCEVGLLWSTEHCGTCGRTCSSTQQCVGGSCVVRCASGTATFDALGATRPLVIPPGCRSVTVRAWGGGGGAGGFSNVSSAGGNGGGGGFVSGALAVTPGETLTIFAGGGGSGGCQGCSSRTAGGTPNGGTGGGGDSVGANGGAGGGGGGASQVLRGTTVLLVAGGGGGGGGGQALNSATVGESATSGCATGAAGASAGTGSSTPSTAGAAGGGGGGGGGSGSSVGSAGTFGRAGRGGTCSGATGQNGSGINPAGLTEPGYLAGTGRGGTSVLGNAPGGVGGRVYITWGQ